MRALDALRYARNGECLRTTRPGTRVVLRIIEEELGRDGGVVDGVCGVCGLAVVEGFDVIGGAEGFGSKERAVIGRKDLVVAPPGVWALQY